ncbi:pentapeptide repeat-containing protein [Chloroflexota bacterium]
MSAETTDRFESREQVAETLRQNRDLSGADLSGLDLAGIKLTGLNMESADLSNADLEGATLAAGNMVWRFKREEF